MITERQLLALDDVIAVLNSEGITKNMRVHRKVVALHTVDAVEVVHGRWIDVSGFTFMPLPKGHRWCTCSECGEEIIAIPYNYCPNCGAKMDLEEK